MNKRIILVSIVIALIGFIAFGFVEKSNESKKQTNRVHQNSSWITKTANNFNEQNPDNKNEEIYYSVYGRHQIPIKMEIVENATLVSDLVPNYPINSISEYTSVEITTTRNNQLVSATSANEVLSPEQKMIINSADRSADILVKVNYKAKSAMGSKVENRELDASLTVVPDVEAEYVGGYDAMIAYLKDNSFDKISGLEKYQTAIEYNGCRICQSSTIFFTVNEEGRTENFKVEESCGNPESDKLLIELVNNMPGWKPAKNSDGTPVKQDFMFVIGPDGC